MVIRSMVSFDTTRLTTDPSTITSDLQSLHILAGSVRRNLQARPIDVGSDSKPSSPTDITVNELAAMDPSNLLIVDSRSLDDFLERHLACSVHLSIPLLVYNRLVLGKEWSGDWDALKEYVSRGRHLWDINRQVVVIGHDKVVLDLLQRFTPIRVLSGGWHAVETSNLRICTGEDSRPLPRGPLHHPSVPSLRRDQAKRHLPKLDTRRGPKLSLNLPTEALTAPLRSSSFGGGFPNKNRAGLTLDLSNSRLGAGPSTAGPTERLPHPQSLEPVLQSHSRSRDKAPPSPASFSGIPRGCDSPYSHQLVTEDSATSRAVVPFIVSTILPSFLYLGPEITTEQEIQQLERLGVRRILNTAIECDDDEALGLANRFDKYLRLPMRDNVEEKNIAQGVRDACDFLDDARLHDAPVYVHCKAGRSRSVTVVLAYLIHANAWTLKTAYAYVAERRSEISPNIGFVAELMLFEEAELGVKKAGGIAEQPTRDEDEKRKHGRESLPAWSSLDGIGKRLGFSEMPMAAEAVGEHETEREVRKDGHYVHSRRYVARLCSLTSARLSTKPRCSRCVDFQKLA